MRTVAVLLVLVSLFGCVGVDRTAFSPSKPKEEDINSKHLDIERMIRSVPLVLYDGSAGAGVLFRCGDRIGVVTAAHLIADSDDTEDPTTTHGTKPITVIGFVPSTEIVEYGVRAKLITLNPTHDWALLEADRVASGMRFAEFSDKLPTIGETVWAVGSPLFDAGTLTKGIVSHPNITPALSRKSGVNYIHSDLMCAKGNSGGGLFDERGVCIGIVVRLHPHNNTTYSISTFYINEDLKSLMLGPPSLLPKFIP